MAEITRQVGDIGVTQFINPGVEDKSGAAMLAAVGQGALDIDQMLAENKLRSELDDMRTIYETGSVAVTGGTETPGLSATDLKAIAEEKDRLGRLNRAREQGALGVDMYRVTAEAALRAAIARRPGLAAEFRQLASDALGTDVAGASIEMLAKAEARAAASNRSQQEAEAEAAAAAAEERGKQLRELIDLAPDDIRRSFTGQTDAEIGAYFSGERMNDPQVRREFAVLQSAEDYRAAVKKAELQASLVGNTLEAQRPIAEASANVKRAELHLGMNRFRAQISRIVEGGITPEEQPLIPEILMQARSLVEKFNGELQSVRTALGEGFVREETEQANRAFQFLDDLIKLPTQLQEEGLKYTRNYFDAEMERNPVVAAQAAMKRVYGDNWVTLYGDPQVAAPMGVAAQVVAADVLPPEQVVASAPTVMQAFIRANANPAMVTDNLKNVQTQYVEKLIGAVNRVPVEKYQLAHWGGGQGIAYQLASPIGVALAANMDDSQKQATADAIAMATRTHLQRAQTEFSRRFPEIAENSRFALRPDGTYIQPPSTISASQLAMVRDFEQRFVRGEYALKAYSHFSSQPAIDAIVRAGAVASPAPTAAPAPAREPSPAPATRTPVAWWEEGV